MFYCNLTKVQNIDAIANAIQGFDIIFINDKQYMSMDLFFNKLNRFKTLNIKKINAAA